METTASAPARLERLVVTAGLWLVAHCALSVVLAAAGWWRVWLVVPATLLFAVGSWLLVGVVPDCRGCSRRGPTAAIRNNAATGVLVAICVAFAVWAGTTHAEQVLPRRDSASNLQAAISLATTGSRVVPVDADILGGSRVLELPGITLASPAFYAVGGVDHPAIQPQFVIGPAATYGLGIWVGGPRTAFWLPGIAGAFGLLAIGLLAARFLGAWWGAMAAGVTAVAFPILHLSRSTYSEPLSMVTLGGGFLALSLAASADDARARRHALLAGLLVGGTTLVRIDGLREAILLLVVVGLAAAQRRVWARPLLVGVGVSTGVGLLAGLRLSPRYLGDIAGSLLPLLAIGVAVALVMLGGLWWQRRGARLPPWSAARLPRAVGGLTALVLIGLASRPLWMTARQDPNDPGARYVAGMQTRQGLPVDGARTYAEQSVDWLNWWLGPISLVLAALALVWLVHHATTRWVAAQDLPPWSWPLLVALGSTLMTLWRPGITPDHPWAERRLVIAIPLVLLLALASIRHLAAGSVPPLSPTPPAPTSSEENTPSEPHGIPHVLLTRLGGRGVGRAVAALAAVGMVVPTALATWPLARARVEAGSLTAVEQVCAALQPRDVVLMVDARAANEWVQVVRGQCGNASLATSPALRRDEAALVAAAQQVRGSVAAAGGRLVYLSADDDQSSAVSGLGEWMTIVDQTVQESEHALERRPSHLDPLALVVRLARP